MMTAEQEYDLQKATLTQIYDRVNELTDDAQCPDTGKQVVITSVTALQAELERVTPTSWWVDRDYEFDDLRNNIEDTEDDSEVENLVIEFCNRVTDMVFDGNLSIEP